MGIFNILSSKNADKALDAIVKGGDALVLTSEEKLQYQQEAMRLHLKVVETIANESSPTAISRRVVALFVLFPFTFLSIGGAVLDIPRWTEAASPFEMPSLAVVAFYFGGHIAKSLKK
jgi:hypothetical protein